MDKHAKFAHLIKYFDLLPSRKGTTQLGNVRWLLRNIHTRNMSELGVDEAVGLLIMISRNMRFGKGE